MRALAVLVAVLTVAFALSPAFTAGFAGFEKGQFPVVLDHWPAQPAGWAFSIWGAIYLWLAASAGYGLLRRAEDAGWHAARLPLAVSLGVGVPWIAVANAAPVAATAMILVMAGFAIAAMLRAPAQDAGWLGWPVGLYAGWLTAASGVAVAVVLSGHGILGAIPAALVLLALVLAVALAVQTARPGIPSYGVAVGWALTGIAVANLGAETRAPYWPVAALALAGLAALALRLARR